MTVELPLDLCLLFVGQEVLTLVYTSSLPPILLFNKAFGTKIRLRNGVGRKRSLVGENSTSGVLTTVLIDRLPPTTPRLRLSFFVCSLPSLTCPFPQTCPWTQTQKFDPKE